MDQSLIENENENTTTNLAVTNIKYITLNLKLNKGKKINEQENQNKQKKRVETETWGLNEDDLEHKTQLDAIESIIQTTNISNVTNTTDTTDKNILCKLTKYNSKILSHIKTKIQSYKQQDILKNRLHNTDFVSLNEVLTLLNNSQMKCHYCSNKVYVLYERIRETKQWSLDRINNDIGHNSGNLLIACLECNLKRRRTNKDAFMFTKNLVITRKGLDC